MKNHFKNNYSRKNNKQQKKNLSSNQNTNSYSKNTSSSNKNNRVFITSQRGKRFNSINESNKHKNNFSSSNRRNPSNFNNKQVSFNTNDIYQESPPKRNFDDWIWGKHSVYEALINERAINRIWCTSEIYSSEKFYILLKEQKSKGVLIEEVLWNRLSQMTSGASHQGVVLQLACSKTISLEKLIEFSQKKSSTPIILALDGITDPHNVGAIIRSAEAFDCKGIIIPQRRSAGLTGTVAKVAAGALEHLPVCRVVNLNRSLEEMKKNGFIVIGLSGHSQLSISSFKEKKPLVLIVGSEDKGISLLTQKKCDFLLSIPLKGKTSSLNASVAAAISIFFLTCK
jgi:23S rRNA (guanosine2251-2'-O)-methyltransferase